MFQEIILCLVLISAPSVFGAQQAVGTRCNHGDTCIDTNAACKKGKPCACNSGFYNNGGTCTAQTAAGGTCIATSECQANHLCSAGATAALQCAENGKLYGFCDATYACATDGNTDCDTTKTQCLCKTDFKAEGDKCKTAAGGACNATIECLTNHQCLAGANAILQCVEDGKLYGFCNATNACDTDRNTDCDTTKTQCLCKTDFKADGDKCKYKGGAGFIQASLATIVITVMASIVSRG